MPKQWKCQNCGRTCPSRANECPWCNAPRVGFEEWAREHHADLEAEAQEALENTRAQIRAKTQCQPDMQWEYCQLMLLPPEPGEDTQGEDLIATFYSDHSTIHIPPDHFFEALDELGRQGWEMVHSRVVTSYMVPRGDLRPWWSYAIESTFDLAPQGPAQVFQTVYVGVAFLFKRPRPKADSPPQEHH
jgi:hypothetical protein